MVNGLVLRIYVLWLCVFYKFVLKLLDFFMDKY